MKCENVQKLLADIKEGDMKHNLDVMMHSPDCNFYDLINAYEMSGAREQIGNMVTEAMQKMQTDPELMYDLKKLASQQMKSVILPK